MGWPSWTWASGWVGVALLSGVARADITAIVSSDRVNVRGRPSLASEVICQLRKDEPIVVLEAINLSNPKPEEPKDWYKILLPTNATVWVSALYVQPDTKVVVARRLNVRAGPGENFSVLGQLQKNDSVREIRLLDDWVEIEPPPGTYAFVAKALVTLNPQPPAPSPEVAATPTTTNESPGVAIPAAPVTSSAVEPLPPKRIVRREGVLVDTISIQAPTRYKLRSADNRQDLNYLLPGSPAVRLATYKKQRVVVTGEEQIDSRWPNLPLLEVSAIELAP